MQHLQISDTVFHRAFAEQTVHIGNKRTDFVADKRKIKTFKLTEYFCCKDIIDAFDFRAAAGDVNGNEIFELLHDTVTESHSEFLDDVVVEFRDFLKNFLADGVLFDSVRI